MAAALEKPSEHPLAEAMLQYAQAPRASPPAPVEGLSGHLRPGRAAATVARPAGAWRATWPLLEENGVDRRGLWPEQSARLAAEGKTPLYFADEQRAAWGVIAVADTLKADQRRPPCAELQADGHRCGDAHRRQQHAPPRPSAARLGIEQVVAEVLPQDKERRCAPASGSRAKRWPWWATASTMRPPWPGPTWALPSAPAPTWPSNRRTWC